MQRLTKRLPDGNAVMDCDSCGLKTSRQCTLCKCRNQLMRRVAAYEDTDLTPEDLNAPFTWQMVLNQAAQKALGMEPSRLRELAEADKAGRCVVLPCKVGDVLYAAETDPIIPLHVMAVAIYLEVEGEAYGDYERISNIGKTVFLTREEAELALKKEKEKFNVDVSQT